MPLSIEFIPAKKIGEPLFRELNDFRRRFIKLKPGIDGEKDFSEFRRFFTDEVTVTLFRDRQRRLRGFYGYGLDMLPGRRVLIYGEYLFIDPAYRGSVSLILSNVLIGLRLVYRYRVLVGYLCIVAQPASFVFLSHIAADQKAWTARDPDIPDAERAVISAFIERFLAGNYDRELGTVKLRTIPAQIRARGRPGSKRHDALRRFEDLNPTWNEGHGLPCVSRLTLRGLGKAIAIRLRWLKSPRT